MPKYFTTMPEFDAPAVESRGVSGWGRSSSSRAVRQALAGASAAEQVQLLRDGNRLGGALQMLQAPVQLSGGAQEDAKLGELLLDFQYQDAKRPEIIKEIRKRVSELGAVHPTQKKQVDKAEYLASAGYQKESEGTAGGVRIWGDATGGGAPGHVMATSGDEHFSFSVPGASGEEDKKKGSRLGGGRPPVRGFKANLVPTARDAKFHERDKDKHVEMREGRPDAKFSHGFHPDFIQPQQFKSVSQQLKNAAEALGAANNYVLFSATLQQELEKSGEELKDHTTNAQGNLVSKTTGRVIPVNRDGQRKIVEARNCATLVFQLAMGLTTKDGQRLLTPEDLKMLNLENGHFVPGKDVRPQDIYEHLRWKESEWLATRKKKA